MPTKRLQAQKIHARSFSGYIENSHPAIISRETFDLVQSEIEKRKPNRRQMNNNSIFATKIICGECGGYYGSKVWHSTSKCRYTGWRCNRKYTGGEYCSSPRIQEEEIKGAFVRTFNEILGDKSRYITQFEELLPLLADTSKLEDKLEEAKIVYEEAIERISRYMEGNARQAQDQEEYERQFNEIADECKSAESLVIEIKDEILECGARREKIRRYLDEFKQLCDIVTEFDESLWQATVESVRVLPDKTLIFTFRDGTEISAKQK